MNTYIVTFEVSATQLEGIKAKIKSSFSYYCPINISTIAVRTEKTAKEVRELITPFFPAGSRIFVIRSGTEAAWLNSYGQTNSDWLKKYL